MDAALHVGLCECTNNSRKGALKECCAHVLTVWRYTSILVRLCDKGQLPMGANQPGKDSCRNLWDHFAKEKGNKQKKRQVNFQFIIYNQIQTNSKPKGSLMPVCFGPECLGYFQYTANTLHSVQL